MKIAVAFDSFKGCVDGYAASRYVAGGLRRHACEGVALPLADGGEGTAAALLRLKGGRTVAVEGMDAFGVPLHCEVALLADGTAAIDMAACCGLGAAEMSAKGRVMEASSYGLGIALLHLAQRWQPRCIVVGLGGTSTCDGGLGMLQALNARLSWEGEAPLRAAGRDLLRLRRKNLDELLPLPPLIFLRDVRAPLIGAEGAARCYAPQKGADAAQVLLLEEGLKHWGEVAGIDAFSPGMGAAGGMSVAGSLLHARMLWGAEYVAQLLQPFLEKCDVVITGEGRTDSQTLQGKAPYVLMRQALAAGVRTLLLSGRLQLDEREWRSAGFSAAAEVSPRPALPRDLIGIVAVRRLLRAAADLLFPQPRRARVPACNKHINT